MMTRDEFDRQIDAIERILDRHDGDPDDRQAIVWVQLGCTPDEVSRWLALGVVDPGTVGVLIKFDLTLQVMEAHRPGSQENHR